ncbi:phytase [Dolichospermum sp. UHCC 0259]|uniref:phytase n=1 Tax=Dolichospermum sp. UHCC 0259 TaxID=2590010 RepID=UPI0020C54C3E|nr:phytase [Dolichospermum sp. UHCC 0259]
MNSIQLNHIGTIKLSGSEISDFDPISQRLFVTGESANKPVLQVVDVSDANNPTQVTNIDLSSLGAGIQSVAVRKGIGTGNSIVAIAISATTSTDPGKIAFYDAVTLTKISEVTVGALPDMITFTADGSKLLVANEGEPSENYAIDPEGSISIIDVSGDIASLDNSKVTTANFTAFNGQKETLTAAGVRLFGLNATVAQDLEPEYIAVSPDGKTAFVTLQENNAFAVLDIATASITKIVPLGFKNHNLPGNGLDASDRDVNGTSGGGGKINIQNWPIFGMYQPDAVSSFQIADKTYYITANEGDSRVRPTSDGTFGNEGSIFNEEARVSSLALDPTAFPNATELKKPENLGRLTVTNKLGDTDGDGDFDQLYAYGARSFSIWDDQGKLVYDSGDQIEQFLKQQTPTFFNANNGLATEFDTRSDNKGPEPESAIVGMINGIPYGFVGLERAGGGVMVYNLSNPTAPEFIQYIRTEGDISPEGLKFISAADSPNAKPMLTVANEVSNTVSFYEILPSAAPTVETSPDLFDDEDPGQATVDQNADADDPAIYVNAENSANSLVLTAVKNAGVRVYNLSGNLLQTVNPGEIRYNNIDLQYGFKLGGESIDIAVASDRGNDKLVIFKINPNSSNGNYLEDITDSNIGTIFQTAPFDPPYEPSSRSSYGLTIYRSPFTNDYYVFTGRRETGDIAQLKLIDIGNGKIGAEIVREFTVPTINGIDPQTEGMVVDQETGILYIGQENVGIWKFDAEPNGSNTGKLIDVVKSLGGSNLVDDVEGLTIYYGANGTGYLIASSQGDNTFAAYTREGNNEFLGRFGIGNNGAIDSVQESDGADVINVPLGANFPYGLFVTQDGNNDPAKLVEDDGEIENVNSNFKFVPWENIANTLPDILKIDTTSYDPRNPVLQPRLTNYEFDNLPKLGTTSTGQDIFLGGFSGLYFQGIADNGNLKFVTHTDRGPNGEPTGQNRPFLLPNFQPEIVSFELNQTTNQITITKRTGLFREDGTTPLTGLPNVQAGAGGTAYTDEIGVDLNGQVLPNDTLGADVEGIVIAPNGDYWLVDEYRPAIYHFDVNGKLLNRFIPQGTAAATEPDQPAGTFGTEVLPAVYAQRRANRGFEAVALEGNKLYAFIQSAIDNPDVTNDATSRNSRNLRILEFDIVSKQVTGEYLYLLDDITGTGNAKTDKIGDAVSLGNSKFAVVERDDRSDNTSNKLIYQIDLATATNINNPANFTLPSGKTIEQLSPAELTTAGIISANKTLIVNAAQVGYTGVEKLEGLALVAPNILALINDNDFNVAGTTIPEKLGIIELPDYLPVTISGTSGNDTLLASASGYTLLGLAGNDSIDGVPGKGGNILDGGAGDDEIFAKKNDTALGGSGNDDLYSDGQGNNTLYGGDGNDQIFPDRNDKVFGDAGNDIIYPGLGGNTLTGGDGQDTFWLANAAYLQSPNIITDFNPAQDLLNVNVDGFKNINQLTFSPQGDSTLISANSNPLAIVKNYELPQFAITSASATEGNIIIFTVTRTGNNSSSQSVTVTTSIATGDTASDTDLTAKTETLTFAPGETTTTFAVQTTQDVLFEGNETFTVSLSNPTNVSIISSTNATAKGTITNDDLAPIFSIATAEASEGNAINFTVTRTGDAQAQQSVTVVTSIATGDTASDTDLTAKTEILTFAQGETTKIFAVQTTQDVLFEGNETFTASLSNATNGAIISSTNATATGTINNDDAAPVFSIAAAQALEGSAINFTLTRTGDAQANQTVTVSTSIEAQNTASATDFSGNTQTFTFAQGETTKTFPVQTTQDSLVEDNETFTVSLSSPTNGAIISSTNGIALGTITDDDTPAEFRISAADALEGNAINFTVTRSRDNLIAQSVTVATSIATDDTASASDLTAKTETLTFATGETSKTFTVQTTQDSLVEGNETFTVSLSDPDNGAVVSSTNATAKGTINNDDVDAAASTFSIAAASATEGDAIIFTVTRTGDAQSNQSVTVATSIATDDTASASDLTAKTETLTFATGETSKTFTVQTTQDSLVEGNETFTVSLSDPDNGAVVSSTNATAKGTINNDDVDATTSIFSIATASATEGNGINFTITRTGDNQSTQSVAVSTAINADDTASNNDLSQKNETLTFALGETTKTFTVQTTQDARVEKDETFTVNLSNSTNGSVISSSDNTTKGVIVNDDIPLATPNNNYIFPIKGEDDKVRLKVSLLSRSSNSINELGVFNVDDAQGNIDGIAPGAAGYNQAAINRAKVVFSAIANLPNGFNSVDSIRLINFNSGDNLKFFLVRNGTIDSVNAGRTSLSNVLFADASNQKITDLGTDGFTVGWEDGSGNVADFNDLVVKVQSTDDKLVIGTALQGGNQREVIDLRDITSQVKVDFSVHREAAFNNEVYFYKIDNADGQIGNLQANAANRANYLQMALNNILKDAQTGANIRFSVANQGIQTGTAMIAGGTILAPMIVVNGTLSQLLDSDANNNPQVYFPYLGVNSDGVDHIRLLGNNTFGFEDLPNGGDLDYNDIIVKMNFTQVV